jgi:ATP synthase B/B' CF(0)
MAETTAHTEAPAGHPKFPPFESEHFPSQLFWLVISFALLYVLMSRIALPRIGGIMAARSKVISDDLAAAEQLKERSNAAASGLRKGAGGRQGPRPGHRRGDPRAAGPRNRRPAQAARSTTPRPDNRRRAIDRKKP